MGNAIKDNRGGDCVELSCEERQSAGGTAWFEFVCTDTRSSYRRGEPGLAVAKGLIQMMGGEIHFQMKKQAKHSAGSVCRPLLMKNRRRRKTQRSRKL